MTIEIIIPAYNCRKTLNKTLHSLQTQTDMNFSVHIIDDFSTEVISDIVSQHSNLNIRLSRNPKNLGCGMTRQVGIDKTTADYIAFLDSDDMLMPYAVERWRAIAEKSPEVDLFQSYFYEQLDCGLKLVKNNAIWCHGKLYKVNFLRKNNIRNSPEVLYADDSFFNSMCTELGICHVNTIPLYLWCNNQASITRETSSPYHDGKVADFLKAMRLSTEFVRSKGVLIPTHLPYTMDTIDLSIRNGQLILDDNTAKSDYMFLKNLLKEV